MTGLRLPFRKMNGLGNDFAVFDARAAALPIGPEAARRIADRKQGAGCDQVIVIEPSQQADAFMRIFNADGSEVSACGNATRCVAVLLAGELGRRKIAIETGAGVLLAEVNDSGSATVDMGAPRFGWRDIPLAREMDTARLDFALSAPGAGEVKAPAAVNVGNPHCIFFVDDVGAYDLSVLGPRIETDPLFPHRVNVSLAQISAPDAMILRTWERGAGLTRACGTAACAAAVTAVRLGRAGRRMDVHLPGGALNIAWNETNNHILMTGPAKLDYEGVVVMDDELGGSLAVHLFA